jgi:2-oxo-4-hydroxy-4-carboxy-5-ureidoimidazoline decarboxylase
MTAKLSMQDINMFSREEAADVLGGLFEHSPWIVRETWARAPFSSVEAFHAALCSTVRTASEEQQLALIRAHPDLVGRAAREGTLTRESTGEQRSAGLGPDDLSPGDIEVFTRYNAAYKERFDFPFVICARENRKLSILAGFENRLGNDPVTERNAAIREIERIAWYRLTDLVDNGPDDTNDRGGSGDDGK